MYPLWWNKGQTRYKRMLLLQIQPVFGKQNVNSRIHHAKRKTFSVVVEYVYPVRKLDHLLFLRDFHILFFCWYNVTDSAYQFQDFHNNAAVSLSYHEGRNLFGDVLIFVKVGNFQNSDDIWRIFILYELLLKYNIVYSYF